ncbi:hypothetical protein AND_007220 [Anopheles darlingi]|uniref:Uncharacterized protein n=1 Tax=Anopheles darlingi TaxID=43151 RepID=W5JE05_ANODA|nr:hypothetical protein AND_007220 [Anopheles darlingi]
MQGSNLSQSAHHSIATSPPIAPEKESRARRIMPRWCGAGGGSTSTSPLSSVKGETLTTERPDCCPVTATFHHASNAGLFAHTTTPSSEARPPRVVSWYGHRACGIGCDTDAFGMLVGVDTYSPWYRNRTLGSNRASLIDACRVPGISATENHKTTTTPGTLTPGIGEAALVHGSAPSHGMKVFETTTTTTTTTKAHHHDALTSCGGNILPYKIEELAKHGIIVRDLAFEDGTFPPNEIVMEWFEILKQK